VALAHNGLSELADASEYQVGGLIIEEISERGRLLDSTSKIYPSHFPVSSIPSKWAQDLSTCSAMNPLGFSCCSADVSNQGSCYSCWSFTTANMLGIAVCKMKQKDWTAERVLSYVETVQCSSDKAASDQSRGMTQKCKEGGTVEWGMKYTKQSGLALEEKYNYFLPQQNGLQGAYYAQIDNTCDANYHGEGAKTKSYECILPQNYKPQDFFTLMKLAIYNYGAVGGAISISCLDSAYSAGVIKKKGLTDQMAQMNPPRDPKTLVPDHAVTFVGYGTIKDGNSAGMEYFVVRNSWGSDWGLNGYFKIQMTNFCGMKYDNVPTCWIEESGFVKQ